MNRSMPTILAMSLMLGACDLAVELPGDITAEELEQPEDLPLLVTSADGVFECAYQQYVLLSAQATGEANRGRESSKVLRDCTICAPCH